jgi:hypothetical protein
VTPEPPLDAGADVAHGFLDVIGDQEQFEVLRSDRPLQREMREQIFEWTPVRASENSPRACALVRITHAARRRGPRAGACRHAVFRGHLYAGEGTISAPWQVSSVWPVLPRTTTQRDRLCEPHLARAQEDP